MEDYYEYLDSNGVTTLYKLIKDDTVALIDSYSVTLNGITTTLDTHINSADIHTPIATIEGMIDTAIGSLDYATPDYVDTKISGLVNSAPETLDTLKELSDALGNDPNFATTVANQIGNKADKDSVYTKQETDTLLDGKANSVHNHVVSDITDFPTIPTKLSQLENDMGFGTGGGSGDTSDCVHKTGDETINGTKTFTNQLYLGAGGTGYGLISAKDNNSILRLFGGTSPSTGANLDLYGEGLNDGSFSLRARTSDKIVGLDGKVDGTLKWNGKNVALDENLVHTSGDETIAGNKTFSNKIKGNLQGNADTATKAVNSDYADSAGNGVDSYGKGWIRFKNGIQMCWGSGNNSNTSTSIVVNFARTFSSPPVISAQCYNPAYYNCWVATKNSNHFTLNFDKASTVAYEWFAIGTWK